VRWLYWTHVLHGGTVLGSAPHVVFCLVWFCGDRGDMVDDKGWRPFWINGDALDTAGVRFSFAWKSVWDDASKAWYELRELLSTANQLPDKVTASQWYKVRKLKIEETLRILGRRGQADVLPGRRSFQELVRLGRLQAVPTTCRNEFMVSSCGLIVVLLHCNVDSRSRELQHRAAMLLEAWLVKMLPPHAVDEIANLAPAGLLQQCPMHNGGICPHMQGALAWLADTRHAAQVRLAYALKDASQSAGICEVAVVWTREVLKTIEPLLDEGLEAAAYTSDAMKSNAAALTACTRKRRVDEDLKTAIIDHMVDSKRAKSGRAAARADGSVDAGLVRKWEERALLEYQAAIWDIAENVEHISMSLDAKRIGQPAEETEVIACTAYPGKLAWWLPPAVMSPQFVLADFLKHIQTLFQ
jgi:hypothetical protein